MINRAALSSFDISYTIYKRSKIELFHVCTIDTHLVFGFIYKTKNKVYYIGTYRVCISIYGAYMKQLNLWTFADNITNIKT